MPEEESEDLVHRILQEWEFDKEDLPFLTEEEFSRLPPIYEVLESDSEEDPLKWTAGFIRDPSPRIYLLPGLGPKVDLVHELGHYYLGHGVKGSTTGPGILVKEELEAMDWTYRRLKRPRSFIRLLVGLWNYIIIVWVLDPEEAKDLISEELKGSRYSKPLHKSWDHVVKHYHWG